MNLDLLVLGLVAFFAILGAMTGGVFQLAHLASVVIAGFVCRPIGIRLGPVLASRMAWSPLWGLLAATVIAFFAVYVGVHIVARLIISKISRSPGLTRVDRLLGFTMGAARSALILYVILSALIFFEKPMSGVANGLHFDTRKSHVADLVRSHNLFATFTFPGMKGLTALSRAAADPAAAAQLAKSPQFKALSQDPRIRSMLGDPSIQRSLQSGDYVSLMQNNRVISALSDPGLEDKLTTVVDGMSEAGKGRGAP